MKNFESDILHFGFIDTEFVAWVAMSDGMLLIKTQHGHQVYIGPGHWRFASTFLGPGKIELSLVHNGFLINGQVRICPIRDDSRNSDVFMAGLNGPLNYGERKFSATLGDPTHAIFYPQN